ncbi:MAG: glycosyltransferase family 2 protein [Ramlibacter sp.]
MPAKAHPRSTVLSIVVPCFNEQAVLAETCRRLMALRDQLVAAGRISPASDIVFVDDGSRDGTWPMIDGWVRAGAPVVGVKLSRNYGHQNALLAGLTSARGDAIVTIDADLQDDETAIASMLDAYHAGHDVVFGVRSRRDSDTRFKRATARGFYRLMAGLGVSTVFDHADYRLLSQRAVRHLGQFKEVHLFLRGIVPLLGLPSTTVHYERRERFAGESKYPVRKMVEFALNGVTSFSAAPLRAIAALGIAVSLACAGLAAWALFAKLAGNSVPGWASTILPIYFLGGVQLFCIGVLGEYVGRIYMESKQRPRFLVEKIVQPRQAAVVETADRRAAVPKGSDVPAQPAAIRVRTRRASAVARRRDPAAALPPAGAVRVRT